MQQIPGEKSIYEFGEFRLDTQEKQLRRLNGEILPLPPKAFELLTILVENENRLLEKTELLDKVWADSFVEEGNLKIYIHTLRKTLDGEFIETVPRRGYRFNADVKRLERDEVIIEKITESKIFIEKTEIEEPENFPPVTSETKSKDQRLYNFALVLIASTGLIVYSIIFRPPEAANNSNLIQTKFVSPEAETLYIQGRVYWNERNLDGLKKSIEYFEKALEKDTNHALAHVGLADSYQLLAEYKGLPTNEAYSKARFNATKALEINPNLAEAYNSLAYTQAFFDWDWQRAEASFKRAIELSPNYATAHHWYSEFLNNQHRFDEAYTELQTAQRLDPESAIIQCDIAHNYFIRREYEKSIDAAREIIKKHPQFGYSYMYLYGSLEKLGREREAIEAISKMQTYFGEDETIVFERIKASETGGLKGYWKKSLEQALANRVQLRPEPIDYAMAYLHVGDFDETFKYLNKSYEERNRWLLEITYDPEWDAIRHDPRYTELVVKIKAH